MEGHGQIWGAFQMNRNGKGFHSELTMKDGMLQGAWTEVQRWQVCWREELHGDVAPIP